MASIHKRGKKIYVIYKGVKEDGSYGQIWVPCENETIAQIRKEKIELAEQIRKDEVTLEKRKKAILADRDNQSAALLKEDGAAAEKEREEKIFQPHNNKPAFVPVLFSDFAERWFDIYPVNNWSHGMLDLSRRLYGKHIEPYFGKMYLHEVTPLEIEEFMVHLAAKKVREGTAAKKVRQGTAAKKKEADLPCLSSSVRRSIYFILSRIFDKAVEWRNIPESPVLIDPPKKNGVSRDIWDEDTIYQALRDIKHPLLHLGVHLSFICTMRNGECCGLTWDCVDFENNEIRVRKTMLRVTKSALEKMPKEEVFFIFPEKQKDSKTLLILKTPKTNDSVRRLYMTEPLKKELLVRKDRYDKVKDFMGSDFNDFNLVFALENGDPVEPHLLEKWFKKWQNETAIALPAKIDFHSMRHSSTTYKLRISNGDIKSVQGDTGHRSANMVVNTYSHMQDMNRHFMMKTLENSFYSQKTVPPETVPQEPANESLDEISKLIKNLQPELRNQLFARIASNA